MKAQAMSKRILVVEDEEDLRTGLVYVFKSEGYTVESAATGQEALHKASRFLPDVVLLDLTIPGMDGIDVCQRIKTAPQTQKTTVFIVSARSSKADKVLGKEVGADDY